jgi:hypothetical protein
LPLYLFYYTQYSTLQDPQSGLTQSRWEGYIGFTIASLAYKITDRVITWNDSIKPLMWFYFCFPNFKIEKEKNILSGRLFFSLV